MTASSASARTARIRPGKRAHVTVRLNAAGRGLLKRFGRLPVMLTVTLGHTRRHPVVIRRKLTLR
jgi:hypothetical protein